MEILGPYVHNIDPIIGQVGGLYLWWYGLGYTLGFLQLHLFLRRRRFRLELTQRDVYTLTLFIMVGVLLGGRALEVAFDEWPFYREHPGLVPAYWLGGMASHGVMTGAALGAVAFAWIHKKPFLTLADELVIAGAALMAAGRLGNFIDGQIVGSLTEVWWGVEFPDADGVRHPVVLYDGAKNLLLVPFLFWVRRKNPIPGATAARFVFWYSFPRIFIDLFRDYPTHRLEIGTGQTLNLLMALLGCLLLYRSRRRRLQRLKAGVPPQPLPDAWPERAPYLVQRIALAGILLFSLTMPSNWTQDIPARYGGRHPGLEHSWLYPEIRTSPRPEGRP